MEPESGGELRRSVACSEQRDSSERGSDRIDERDSASAMRGSRRPERAGSDRGHRGRRDCVGVVELRARQGVGRRCGRGESGGDVRASASVDERRADVRRGGAVVVCADERSDDRIDKRDGGGKQPGGERGDSASAAAADRRSVVRVGVDDGCVCEGSRRVRERAVRRDKQRQGSARERESGGELRRGVAGAKQRGGEQPGSDRVSERDCGCVERRQRGPERAGARRAEQRSGDGVGVVEQRAREGRARVRRRGERERDARRRAVERERVCELRERGAEQRGESQLGGDRVDERDGACVAGRGRRGERAGSDRADRRVRHGVDVVKQREEQGRSRVRDRAERGGDVDRRASEPEPGGELRGRVAERKQRDSRQRADDRRSERDCGGVEHRGCRPERETAGRAEQRGEDSVGVVEQRARQGRSRV